MATIADFLKTHYVKGNGLFTHTGIAPMLGKYFIPPEHLDVFYKLYVRSLKKNEVLSITEIHEEISPIIIDIDFRFNESIGIIRQYTIDDLKTIIKIYNEQISKFFDFKDELHAYIFEKTSPVRFKGNIKDGIHIMYPQIKSVSNVQLHISKLQIITVYL